MKLTNCLLFAILLYYRISYSISTENGESLSLSYLHWKLHQSTLLDVESTESGPETGGGLYSWTNVPSPNSSDVLPDCQAFITEFSVRAADFIQCAVNFSRPIHFCESCVEHYQKAKRVFADIEENDEDLDNCKAILLNSDRVQVINSVHSDIESIWNNADCGRCFSNIGEYKNGTVHFTLTESTEEFLGLYDQFKNCIPQNTSYNATVCSTCSVYYNKMNSLFDKLLNDKLSPQHVCMDIVDMMNYTRLTWGEQLNCTNVHREYIAVSVVGGFLLLLPVIFYVTLRYYGEKKTRNLMKEKRLSLFEHSQEFGNLNSPSNVMNQSDGRNSVLSGSHDTSYQSEVVVHNTEGNQQSNLQNRRVSSYQTFS